MTSPIPQTPQPPDGRNRRQSFWRGVFVAIAVIGGLWFAFNVYMNWKFGGGDGGSYVSYSGGHVTNGTYTNCSPERRVTVEVDGRTETVASGKSQIWKFTDRTIAWSCGRRPRTLVCHEGTQYLLVVRYPDSDVLALECEVLSIPSLRDAPT